MKFRRRLLVSLLLLLVLPVGATALLATRFASDSKTAQADARIGGALPAILDLYRHEQTAARRAAAGIASSPAFATALRSGDAKLDTTLRSFAREQGLRSVLLSRPGKGSVGVSGGPLVAAGSADVITGPGAPSRITVSALTLRELGSHIERITGLGVQVASGGSAFRAGSLRGSTIDTGGTGERSENVEVGGKDRRARIFSLPRDSGPVVRLALVAPGGTSVLSGQHLELAAALAAFLLLAIVLLAPLYRDLRDLHEKVEQEAVTDELTGLPNRRAFQERFQKEILRSRRFGHDLSLMVLDIDDFKKVNDTHGHDTGDVVLKYVAAQVRAESRGSDEPARYGGEEFIVALPETSTEGAARQAERLRRKIADTPCETDSGELRVTASIGIAGTKEHSFEGNALFAAADAALYEAKRLGKNRIAGAGIDEVTLASSDGRRQTGREGRETRP